MNCFSTKIKMFTFILLLCINIIFIFKNICFINKLKTKKKHSGPTMEQKT